MTGTPASRQRIVPAASESMIPIRPPGVASVVSTTAIRPVGDTDTLVHGSRRKAVVPGARTAVPPSASAYEVSW